jgi:hypothetical protein
MTMRSFISRVRSIYRNSLRLHHLRRRMMEQLGTISLAEGRYRRERSPLYKRVV